MSKNNDNKFVIVGAGLGGALAAVYLGQAGHQVDIYEMRGDPREAGFKGGRSINLALSYRGLCALEKVGLSDEVLSGAVPMPGRMIHSVAGELTFQPYGLDGSQAINSVSRGGLNLTLLNAAARCPGVTLHFNQKCLDVDLDSGAVTFEDTRSGQRSTVEGGVVMGADGAFSAVRARMQRLDRFDYSQSYLEHGYKELTIPPGPNGRHAMTKNALHIWPRRSFMMIALPNADGSFTVTCFWPFEGSKGFGAIHSKDDLLLFFGEQFPDAIPLMPTLAEDYFTNPTSSLVTVRCSPWYHGDRVVMLGDACHAVVPFYGQGMNAAFEDVIVLTECLAQFKTDRRRAFEEYYRLRKVNTDALADLAVENFIEMRDHTGSPAFLRKKKWEKRLGRWFPNWYTELYTMVSFTRTPYAEAVGRARRQDRTVHTVVTAALAAVLIVFVSLLWWILTNVTK